MKYALTQVLPDVPAGRVFAGIDWADADHVACVVGMAGRVIDRFGAAHDKAGIDALISRLRRRLESIGARVSIHTLRGIGYLLTE